MAACALALVKDRGGRRVHEGPAVCGCGPSVSSGSLLTSLSLCFSPSPLSPSPPLFLIPFPLPCPNSHALALTLSTLAGEPASGVWPWLSHRVTQPQPRSQALGATAGPTGAAEGLRTQNKWHQRTTELRILGPAIRVHRSWQDSGMSGAEDLRLTGSTAGGWLCGLSVRPRCVASAFLPQIFTERLLCAKRCSRPPGDES